MSFNEIINAYNNPSKKDGMSAIIEIINRRMTGSLFLIRREHMATVGLFHCLLNKEGKMVSQQRVMGGSEDTIAGFLAGAYLGYDMGIKDAG